MWEVHLIQKIMLLCLLLFVAASAQYDPSGPVLHNAQFTDLNGKSYDLYKLLDAGKHVYLHYSYRQ